ncbi:hypothetical protein DY000_02025878 [Brassica cretica]|uniref:Uncharacterized protein n=1 Tax=Brassica cretica TaxID=69181 RepID=A0ABQ7EF18_BRACR|nr:hypothetical protein DY000_02025878 [Brassica cretica]
MDDLPRRPINKEREVYANLQLASLLGTNGQWDVTKLLYLFPENEVTRILHMQVGNVHDQDVGHTPLMALTRVALHYICPYQVMEISIGDFGAFRDGLEAKRGDSREGDALIKCPSGIRKLESAPKVSNVASEGRGRIFDFSRVQHDPLQDVAESSSRDTTIRRDHMAGKQTERYWREELVETSGLLAHTEQRPAMMLHQSSNQHEKDLLTLKRSVDGLVSSCTPLGGFALGYGDINSGNRSNKSKNSHRSNSTWSRKSQMGLSGGLVLFWKCKYEVRILYASSRIIDAEVKLGDSGNRLSWGGVREILHNGLKEKVWVQCRLDRAFGSAEWFMIFPQSHTSYLKKTGSDNRPIFTSLANCCRKRTGRFMFDKQWCKKEKVAEVIRRGWCNNFATGQGSVSERIKACRQELRKWKRHANVSSNANIKRLRRQLEGEESKKTPNIDILPSLRLELEKAYDEEEAYWKCKNSWL